MSGKGNPGQSAPARRPGRMSFLWTSDLTEAVRLIGWLSILKFSMKSFVAFGFAVFALGIIGLSPKVVSAANITWDGGGVTNNWSDCLNWSGNVCPSASDSATFNGSSTKPAIIDANVSIQSLNMNTGYTGVITQAADLSLSLNFNHNTQDGTFTWSAGRLTFSGSSAAVLNLDTGDDIFGDLEFNKGNDVPVTVTSNDEILVFGDLLLTNGFIQTSYVGTIYSVTINAQGDVIQSASFDGLDDDTTNYTYFVNLDFGNDALVQTYTVNGGVGLRLRLDSVADASDEIIFAAPGALTAIESTTGFAGDLPISNPNDYPVAVWHWQQGAGAYDASAQSSWSFSEFAVMPGAEFVSPALVTAILSGNYDWNVDGTHTFNDFTINKTHFGSIHLGLGADMFVVLGDLELIDGGVWDGVFDVRGNITQHASYDGGAGFVDFGDDLTAQTYTVNGGGAQTLRFNSAADASDSLVFAAAGGAAVEVTSGFSGNIPVLNPLNITPSFWLWNQAAGTYDASAQTSWNIDALTISGGTFVAPVTTTAWRGASTWDVNGTQTFNNLVISRDGLFRPVTLGGSDSLIVNGDLSLLDGKLNYQGLTGTGSVRVRGDVLVGPLWDGGNVALRFIGNAAQTFDLTGATSLFDGDVVINKAAGQVTLMSDLVMDYAISSTQDLTITAGTLDVGIATNYDISLNGHWTNSGSFQARQGVINFIGGSQRISGTTTFYNLNKNSLTASSLILAAGRIQTILGDLSLTGGPMGLLTVRSSVAGSQASIDVTGFRTLEYLRVKDNNNLNATTMTCGTGCVDLGNNLGWVI